MAGKPKLTNYQRIRKIEETLEAIRPMLQRDHGDVTLVEVDGKKIYVELTGACRDARWKPPPSAACSRNSSKPWANWCRCCRSPRWPAPDRHS
jgi:hypothetical protein